MNISEFDYRIPEDRIAQFPLSDRDASRLLVLQRESGRLEHRLFRDITEYMQPQDVLVLNDTKVFPARICGAKTSGGKAEITLLKEIKENVWEALVKGLHEGIIVIDRGIKATVSRLNSKLARVEFAFDSSWPGRSDIRNTLDRIGAMPLPVYIKRHSVKSDAMQYQTVYARNEGAVAAPTAGLHFTNNLLNTVEEKGIIVKTITLHVGYGTFKPVTATELRDHQMEEELFEIPQSTADAVNSARLEGRRIIAVGTTVTRALESSARDGKVQAGKGAASIFIYPGYRFSIVDCLITNFHLPKSTPMMLASAFSGLDLLKKAYKESRDMDYRFFSYGDAMLLI
jgi:S-adenosylmethionine:tRNA ribosyltransferase-isomerase